MFIYRKKDTHRYFASSISQWHSKLIRYGPIIMINYQWSDREFTIWNRFLFLIKETELLEILCSINAQQSSSSFISIWLSNDIRDENNLLDHSDKVIWKWSMLTWLSQSLCQTVDFLQVVIDPNCHPFKHWSSSFFNLFISNFTWKSWNYFSNSFDLTKRMNINDFRQKISFKLEFIGEWHDEVYWESEKCLERRLDEKENRSIWNRSSGWHICS